MSDSRLLVPTVETCSSGQEALELLREKQEPGQGQFDLVLSDVYMPDMDGFRLLEHIGLELDLPVIMMSSNGETNVVLRGVTHGAVDFLIKPVRIEELRNVWQHVVRRRSIALTRTGEEAPDDQSEQHGTKRKDGPMLLRVEHEDRGSNKKPRVVWTAEMHAQFVNAVNTLGIDKAVPKRILDLMNVEGLTRENVASHLQKYRIYLKRVQGGHGGRSKSAGIMGMSTSGLYSGSGTLGQEESLQQGDGGLDSDAQQHQYIQMAAWQQQQVMMHAMAAANQAMHVMPSYMPPNPHYSMAPPPNAGMSPYDNASTGGLYPPPPPPQSQHLPVYPPNYLSHHPTKGYGQKDNNGSAHGTNGQSSSTDAPSTTAVPGLHESYGITEPMLGSLGDPNDPLGADDGGLDLHHMPVTTADGPMKGETMDEFLELFLEQRNDESGL